MRGAFCLVAGLTAIAAAADARPPQVDVPSEWVGKPVVMTLTVKSRSDVSFPFKCRVIQYDGQGEELPEYAFDPRWTSWRLPARCELPLRVKGRIHPKAAKLKVDIETKDNPAKFDRYGRPRAETSECRARYELADFAIVPDADEPRWDGSFFHDGALVLDDTCAFWFATESLARWSSRRKIKDPSAKFFPVGTGTLEAWFRPAAEQVKTHRPIRLLEASGHTWKLMKREPEDRDRGTRLAVDWDVAKGTFALVVREDPELEAKRAEAPAGLKPGVWSHVAVTFDAGGEARLYVNGQPVARLPFGKYRYPLEVYLGSGHVAARVEKDVERRERGRAFFTGEADDLRVSSVVRYDGAFTPSRAWPLDAETRALFTFENTFDGVCGGGIGWISGTIRSDRSRLTGKVEDIEPIDHANFRSVPSDEDLRTVYSPESTTLTAQPGETVEALAPDGLVMDYVAIENVGTNELAFPIVLNAGEGDPRSWGDLADSLGVGPDSSLPPRERVRRMFQWLVSKCDYFINHTAGFRPDSDLAHNVEFDTLWQLNAYGRFECGPMNRLASEAFALGCGVPSVEYGGYGHGFCGAFYDGDGHLYDLSAMMPYSNEDGTSEASLADLEEAPGVIARKGFAAEYYVRFSERGFGAGAPSLYSSRIGVRLRRGEKFTAWRGNFGHMNNLSTGDFFDNHYAQKANRTDYTRQTGAVNRKHRVYRVDRFFPDYANGFLEFHGRPEAGEGTAFTDLTPTSFVYRVDSRYPIVAAEYAARRRDGRPAAVAVSTDGGKRWRKVSECAVKARKAYKVRVMAPIAEVESFDAKTVVELNNRLLTGNLKPGRNRLSFKADTPGTARLTFGWRRPRGHEAEADDEVVWGAVRGYEQRAKVTAKGLKKLVRVGDEAVYPCEVKAGKYLLLVLDRFPSHAILPAEPRLELVKAGGNVPFGRPINEAVMLHKQEYGEPGGRAAWKWDFPTERVYPYEEPTAVDLPDCCELRFRLASPVKEGEVELGGVLLIPWPDRDTRADLIKRLCSLNRQRKE